VLTGRRGLPVSPAEWAAAGAGEGSGHIADRVSVMCSAALPLVALADTKPSVGIVKKDLLTHTSP
jgi:hypothetical protein